MASDSRLLIISPVRNEAAHIDRVVDAVSRQTVPPTQWIVVNDNSTDQTQERLEGLAQAVPFMRVVETPSGYTKAGRDRLAAAAAYRAFNWGLRQVGEWKRFSYIGKLDGDIVLPDDYFERLLNEFDHDPELGIAGGALYEQADGEWRLLRTPADQATAPARLYLRACFEAVGGFAERQASDPISSTYARMHGFRTRTFSDIHLKHLRHSATGDGSLRGRARHGEHQYILQYPFWWVLVRAGVVGVRLRPYVLSGIAYIYGYLRAAVGSTRRVEDDGFRLFVRSELRDRLRRTALRRPPTRPNVGEG